MRDHDRDDFVFELSGFLRGLRLVLARRREFILLRAGNSVLLGYVFGGGAHVVLVVNVPEPVDDHAIDELRIAHAEPVARTEQHMGCGAHVFLPAGNDDVCVAAADRLRRQHHRLEARSADLVDGHGRHRSGQPRLDERLPRGVLTAARSENLAEDHFRHLIGLDLATREELPDNSGAEIRRGRLGD